MYNSVHVGGDIEFNEQVVYPLKLIINYNNYFQTKNTGDKA